MPLLNTRFTSCALAIALLMIAPLPASAVASRTRVRLVIISSQHLGAHGIGYSTRSLAQLSRKLSPADIPTLISLVGDEDLRVGVQFALASQCEPAILPVRDAAIQHKMDFLAASDTMDLIATFSACNPQTRNSAIQMHAELDKLRDAEYARTEQESKRKAENEARIQRNGLKLLDPEQAKTLTREERLEVFRCSLAAMGLTENGPMTPDQKKLVDRMYRSMVLDEVKTPPNH